LGAFQAILISKKSVVKNIKHTLKSFPNGFDKWQPVASLISMASLLQKY